MGPTFALAWLALAVATGFASPQVQGPWGVAYPPADATAPRPAVVFLHGMWAGPEEACPLLREAASRFGFLVCPRGNTPFDAGVMWSGTAADAAGPVRAALDEAARMAQGKLDRAADGTLIGYSNGAYFAAELARAQPGRWPGLVLIGMKLDLDPARLRAAGVRRVVLAAGDQDETRPSMQALAQRFDDGGLPSRFIGLGPGGHAFPPDMPARMCDAIAWVRAVDRAVCEGM
jgi:predicted esterase